jgi:hypothetical protein
MPALICFASLSVAALQEKTDANYELNYYQFYRVPRPMSTKTANFYCIEEEKMLELV